MVSEQLDKRLPMNRRTHKWHNDNGSDATVSLQHFFIALLRSSASYCAVIARALVGQAESHRPVGDHRRHQRTLRTRPPVRHHADQESARPLRSGRRPPRGALSCSPFWPERTTGLPSSQTAMSAGVSKTIRALLRHRRNDRGPRIGRVLGVAAATAGQVGQTFGVGTDAPPR